MRRVLGFGAFVLFAVGCTHLHLQHKTVKQAGTVSDLQYQQVLNNLALFACNPEALPSHVTLGSGTVQVTTLGTASFGAEIPTEGPSVFMPAVSGERAVLGQWNIEPVVEADTLELLRLAYLMAFRPGDPELRKEVYHAICRLGVEFQVLPSLETVLALWRLSENYGELRESERQVREAEIRSLYREARQEAYLPARERPQARKLLIWMHEWCVEGHIRLGPEEVVTAHNLAEVEQAAEKIEKLQELLEEPLFQQRWLSATCDKNAVPKCACYVGCYCDCHKRCCYVWVLPEHYRALREFTLVILALAPPERQEISPFGPVFSASALR